MDEVKFFETLTCIWLATEAATRGVLRKKVFLKISQNSQENICVVIYNHLQA